MSMLGDGVSLQTVHGTARALCQRTGPCEVFEQNTSSMSWRPTLPTQYARCNVPLNPALAVPPPSKIAAWVDERYEAGGVERCDVHRRDYPLLYRVGAAQRVRWLRLYSLGHFTSRRVEAQVGGVRALALAGASVARPIPGRDHELVQELDAGDERHLAVLFSDAPGDALDPCDLRGVSALGAAVARMHRIAESIDTPALDRIDFESLAAAPLRRLASHPAAASVLDEVQGIAESMRALLPGALPLGLCHGDVHLGNANIDADGTVTIFDFDELARGPLAYDLACIWRKCRLGSEDEAVADRQWGAYHDGYETIRPTAADERSAVPPLATLRAIWTMAMPARYVGIWGDDWLRDPTYFTAHLGMIRGFAARALANADRSRG